MKPIYIGPSWAVRSFNTPDDSDSEITNIANELNLDVTNLAECGFSNRMLLQRVQKYVQHNPNSKGQPIIWFYSEPFLDSWWYENCAEEQFIQTSEWVEIRSSTNKKILAEISNLDHPISLIGAHSDINECNYSNIDIIHPSWQKFLAKHCGAKLDVGWGAEVAHKVIIGNPSIKASYSIVDAVVETFNTWHKLEMNNLFQICHPNILGTQLFANEIKNSITNWLIKHQ